VHVLVDGRFMINARYIQYKICIFSVLFLKYSICVDTLNDYVNICASLTALSLQFIRIICKN
jgi:hypothetical protein